MVLVLHHPVSLVQMAETQSKAVIHQERDWKRTGSLSKSITVAFSEHCTMSKSSKGWADVKWRWSVTLVILMSAFYV